MNAAFPWLNVKPIYVECQLLGCLKLECSFLETVNHDSLALCRVLSLAAQVGVVGKMRSRYWQPSERPVRGGHIQRGLWPDGVSLCPELVSTLPEQT